MGLKYALKPLKLIESIALQQTDPIQMATLKQAHLKLQTIVLI